jgi:hypothetical protein
MNHYTVRLLERCLILCSGSDPGIRPTIYHPTLYTRLLATIGLGVTSYKIDSWY